MARAVVMHVAVLLLHDEVASNIHVAYCDACGRRLAV